MAGFAYFGIDSLRTAADDHLVSFTGEYEIMASSKKLRSLKTQKLDCQSPNNMPTNAMYFFK